MNAVITTQIDNLTKLKDQLSKQPTMEGLELASKVSTKKPYFFGNPDSKLKVSALDLGIKSNILKEIKVEQLLLFPQLLVIEVYLIQPDTDPQNLLLII